MSFELDQIDNVEIYSFDTVEILREFVTRNNLIEYEERCEGELESSQRKYNTRLRASSDQSRLGDALSCYLNKLDCDQSLLDPAGEDMIAMSASKRRTRSRSGRMSLPECGKIHCRLGCICDQTDTWKKKNPGQHCGRFECMFECNCARKLRSSTRAKHQPEAKKVSCSGSVCSRSSSSSSTSLRKSKRCKTKVNYSSYSKTGSCSDTSTEMALKPAKFRSFSESITVNNTQKLKLEILSKNYHSIRDKILDFLKKICIQLIPFEWKELCFSYDRIVSVRLVSKPLLARITKFKAKEVIKRAELEPVCNKFPMVCIHLFRYKKNSANKENKEPDKSISKVLPRLLCRKANRTWKPDSRKIFTNLESLLGSLPKKYDKISDILKNYRDYGKINLFSEEKEFLTKNDSKMLYDPFSDESVVIDCYKKVDCRALVDSVAETLNDMISVVCTHKENTEKQLKNRTLPSSIQDEAPKRRSNVIILKRNMHKTSHQLAPQGRTLVKIVKTNVGNKGSLIDQLIDEKPIFKVSLDQPVTTLATIKQNLLNTGMENKKRKRKQDLSFLSTKIININRVEASTNQSDTTLPFIVSRTLFSKKFKPNIDNQITSTHNLIKQEPEIFVSESSIHSQNLHAIYHNENPDASEEPCESSPNFEYQMPFTSMLKLDLPSCSNSNSDSCRKFSISSNSSSFKANKSFEEDELMDSDAENDDDYLSKSSDSTKSSGRKNISLNLHSVRERQRRLRLKNLLTKLKYALYDIDENTSSFKKINSNFKHSKQATLAEAVDSIKKLETQGQQLENELENLKKENIILLKRLELAKSEQAFTVNCN